MTASDNLGNPAAAAQEANERRQNLLRYPAEIPGVDYKAASPLGTNDFSTKLIKQVIAFANGGGGTLVIGFKEDDSKRPQPDPEMTPGIAASYDTSKLSEAVNKAVRGEVPVPLTVFMENHDGITYPVIEVQSFTASPFFCRIDKADSQGKPILKQGALYIRTARSTSEELATPEDWQRLLEVAVAQRQDDLLGRFGNLLRQFGLSNSAPTVTHEDLQDRFESWLDQQKARAEALLIEGKRQPSGYYFFAYQPKQIPQKLDNDQQLLQLAQASRRPNTGWPIGLIPYNFRNPTDRFRATEAGLEVVIGQNGIDHFDYWLLQRNGAFFIYRNLSEDEPRLTHAGPGRVLMASTVIWRVAEAIDHCIALNRNIGTNGTTPIWFAAEYSGLQGRQLSNDYQNYSFFPTAPAMRDRVRFVREFTFDQMIADADGIVADVTKQVFALFGFFEAPDNLINKHLQEYRASKVS
ncbi:hypothetical protein DVJ83_18910 (plasmid) [Deinococcus wulumuqiensis]|uniref:Schlafen AlbA-2 domain-containing protein n=1 Tax=Deinococcus wulumuqiensis TaxID=980427 RepID=A0A345IND0_9DEIO|nr:RNA-binding domain-containing protein [Deinococcus wulumuqiensis]AXH01203.1 hypothetical protein DVJ83_18910 [Deinococcus wulumuqiensis]